ncbi:uncharacterized protein LOC127414715 isoform X3 [Myxocyprinus asiaticus]|uniref:uncharacterized protein LOC127414715 isoform X3 n=1 Tax=Myxocyprinus asiaticus TaxID=70543 RepID=UPI002221D1AD|nr:uncharacterized protein LOC127414715 isoform X3 [Myxocyprinus asiaticus]
MASTLQSAQEFLGNGRTLLTGSLLNYDCVIEALNQGKFFIDDELDSVTATANSRDRLRNMLDIVISKGEEACYKFLKILDKKRFEVFPRPGVEYPDLHHWISCFSFQDELQSQTTNKEDSDPCTRYQGLLKWKARQILDDNWNQRMNFLKNDPKRKPFTYIPLVLDTDSSAVSKLKKNKAYKKCRSKKLKTYIPTDKKMLSPKHLLTNDEKSILLVGKPGVGKTTVSLEILRLWTEDKSIQVSYMFYFDEPLMRVFSQSPCPQTLKDLLFHNYISPDEVPDHVLENIESNSENVVLIFDGVMDVIGNSVIKQLLDKELLNEAKVLTTCRPEAEDTGYLSEWLSYRVEVQGFNHESIREYFKWMLGTEDESGVCALDNPELFSLCSVPLYAFIVTACISISPIEARNKPFTITEMYVRIFRFCMKQHGFQNVEHLDKYITDNKSEIKYLAVASYQAMLAKTVNLTDLDQKDKSVQNAFLTTTQSRNPSTPTSKVSAFLHNTMQEFWAALFLILNPDNITHVLDKCNSDEDGKYLKYIIPFLTGLLSDKLVELIKCLVPVAEIQAIHVKYFEQIIDTFLYTKEQNEEGDCEEYVEADNILFVCRCLYEYQSPEACLLFLAKVQYYLDLQDQTLDPHQCCVVSYVISQSRNRSVKLDLTECTIHDPGLKLILGSLKNLKFLRSSTRLLSQIWRVALEAGQFSDFDSLLRLLRFEIHLSVHEKTDQKMFQRIGEVLKQKRSESVHLYLYVDKEVINRSLQQDIFESLPNIATIRIFPHQLKLGIESELYLQGAIYEMKTGHRCVRYLLSVFSNNQRENTEEQCAFLLKLHSHAKNMDVCPVLQPVFHALPPAWVVLPSAMSLLLQTMEVLNLKKPAELGVTYDQSELKQFLLCMPYITEIRFSAAACEPEDIHKIVKIVADLFILASESKKETLRSLSTACSHSTFPFAEDNKEMQSTFFLDIFTQLTQSSSGKTLLPALKPILMVAPAVWVVDLRKLEKTLAPIEMLKLQPAVKKTVELSGWSYDTDKLRNFLNYLPYISHICCAEQFFQTICEVLSADREWNPKQVSELLRSLGLSISLMDMLPSRICKAVGTVFKQLNFEEDISLSLLPKNISCLGSAFLFSNVKRLQTLRISPRFVRAALKEIYQKRAGHLIVKFVRSSADLINLCLRELDSTDCKALCFALHYSDGVKLNLLNAVIPNNETESIVKLLQRVSDLRIDRKLLLNFLHASKYMEKQGYSASALLTALNHKLDFSCHSSIGSGRFGHDSGDLLTLSFMDFTAISSAIKTSACDTEIILYDCQADDSALEILFPILHKVHLQLGKHLLCQILTLILNAPNMAMSLKWALSLSKALGQELDLSYTPVNYRICESLQLVLDNTEELTHLNLSHCQLTDACLDLLLPYLCKILILDLTGNDITDKGAQRLCKALDGNSLTKTIWLCDNQITEIGLLVEEARIETLHANKKRCAQQQSFISKDLGPSQMEKTVKTFIKREDLIKDFEPELAVNHGKISYRFQCNTGGLFMCRETGLVFGMKGSGCVEYSVVHWDMRHLINTHYKPAGPLFDIKTPTGEIYELHLPHCETHVDEIGNISVVHIHKDILEFLTPVKMTESHIAVNVCGLSQYGLVDESGQNSKMLNGQVLLFQEPDMSKTQQRIWVFLLPSNVPLSEQIKEHQREYVFIQTSSDCKLMINSKYTLISKKANKVQPKDICFEPLHAGNHHPTFEVFLDKCVTEMRIKIQRKRKESNNITYKNAWTRRIILKTTGGNHTQMRSEEHSNISGKRHCRKLKNWKSDLSAIMEELSSEQLKKLKYLMQNCDNRDSIPLAKLEKAENRYELVNLVVETWGFEESVKAIKEFMIKLPRRDNVVTDRLEPYLKHFDL